MTLQVQIISITRSDHNDTKFFIAATVNNALYDYDEYAAADGLLTPKQGIKIMVTSFAKNASTPMLSDIGVSAFSNGDFEKYFFNILNGTGGLAVPLIQQAPDLIYGYQWNSNQFYTDQIKETAYHEFAHASHYAKVGQQFWKENIRFVVDHKGYGNAGDPGVERTDLIEMWAYFMGREYAHKRYGANAHSLRFSPNFTNSWYAYNENRYWPVDNASIFESGHIPAGFLHDICDDNTYNIPRGLDEHTLITSDEISGYQLSTIYNQLDGSTTSANTLIDKLATQLPPGINNTIANFNTLRNLYGY